MPCSADHSAVQDILNRIHEEGTKYVVSVSNSVKIARSGYTFAMSAQSLCTALEKESSNKIIHEYITRMKKVAKDAHTDAKTTADMFRANMQGFTEVW
jgi:hypothetical protein